MAGTFGDDALADSITGGSGGDTIYGGADGGTGGGTDQLYGADGGDTLFGGADGDTLVGGAGADRLFGGLGDDTLQADVNDTAVIGGAGTDTARFSDGADVVTGARDLVVERIELLGGADTFDVTAASTPMGSTFQLSALNGTNGFRLDGVAMFDQSGLSVASAGDVNGDGYADLIVGAYQADPNGVDLAGSSYVVFGGASGWSPTVALSSLDGTTGFRLDGAGEGDLSGTSVASAGDVNGDGYADLIVGAVWADPNGENSGSSYVVFGQASGWASTVALSSLNGTTGFRLDGAAAGDLSGWSVASAGDVNGDGFADVIVGAYRVDPAGVDNAGSSYVVFGKATGWTSAVNLSSLNGTTGFWLYGAESGDETGYSVASAGDVNGDGYADLIVGAWLAYGNGAEFAGSSYVVFGEASGWSPAVALASLDGTTGFRLDGAAAYDRSGQSVASAGDLNGDGYADLIVGAGGADPNGAEVAGSSYVVFGKASGWSADLDLSSLNGTTGFRLDGVAASDGSGLSVASAGDLNGDGYADLIVGAVGADPNGPQSGSSYVVFGRASGWSPTVALSSLDGTTGFRLDGAAAGDGSGQSVASAGDVNGDGFADLIVGAYQADPNGSLSGSSYVVFGGAHFGAGAAGAPYAVDGGTGDDTLTGQGAGDTFYGANDADTLSGAGGTDWLFGGAGIDTLYGGDAGDKLWGGLDNDALFGGAGTDSLNGKEGADTMSGGAGNDYYWVDDAGDAVDETSAGSGGSDTVWIGVDDYTVGSGVERANVQLASGATVTGGATDNWLYGGAGNDVLRGGGGVDTVFGNDGDDRLDPGIGASGSVNGGAGVDVLALDYSATSGVVTVNGATASGSVVQGATTVSFVAVERRDVTSGSNNDLLRGGAGDDWLDGRGGIDQLHGADGIDVLRGDAGNDQLWGGAGTDSLFGGDGADMIQGGQGADVMTGGAGRDVYRISIGDGADAIADFAGGEDRIDLLGALAVSGGLGTDMVMLSGGGSILAGNGHLWQAADFF